MNLNPWVLALAVLSGVVLAGAGLSLFALWRAHALVREIGGKAAAARAQRDDTDRGLRDSVDSLTARLAELERQPAAVVGTPVTARPSLNLSKRSQALRMHRQGQPPEQIARTLEIPRQEVELLLKVHRIVLANV
jgi:hypothetical protein